MKEKTIGNIKDRIDIELELENIGNFIVEIKKNTVTLKTIDLLFKSDLRKLEKYFNKFDYTFNFLYVNDNYLILSYKYKNGGKI